MKYTKMWIALLLLTSVFLVSPVTGQDDDDGTDFIASPFEEATTLDLSNGAVDEGWNEVTYYKDIKEFGESGYAKFAVNESHIFALFAIDSTKDWGALEFGAYDEFCMVDGNDGWTFYIDQETGETTIYDEHYTGSAGPPEHDATNDLLTEVMEKDGYHMIEVARVFDTGDEQDLVFASGDLWNVKFASSTHHATGGLEHPTEFGPSDIYFLSVQTGGEVVVPNAPDRVDYDFWKMIIFIGVFVSAFLFVAAHMTVRQILKPLEHPNPVVDKNYEPPTLKSRWEETFGEEDNPTKKTKPETGKDTVEA